MVAPRVFFSEKRMDSPNERIAAFASIPRMEAEVTDSFQHDPRELKGILGSNSYF